MKMAVFDFALRKKGVYGVLHIGRTGRHVPG